MLVNKISNKHSAKFFFCLKTKQAKTELNNFLSNIAEQVALNPKATENTIDTLSKYLASSTGISTESYQEILQQLALSVSNTDGKGNLTMEIYDVWHIQVRISLFLNAKCQYRSSPSKCL